MANQEYSFNFLTGSKDVQVYTGTMTAELWDWNGVGASPTSGTNIGTINVTFPAASNVALVSQNFTSGGTTQGNVYVRFNAPGAGQGYQQPLLDNINVSAIPEPSALLLSSLGALLVLRRRRF